MKQNSLLLPFLAILLSFLCTTSLHAQSWWRGYSQDSLTIFSEIIPTEDGHFVLRYQRYALQDKPATSYIFKKINSIRAFWQTLFCFCGFLRK